MWSVLATSAWLAAAILEPTPTAVGTPQIFSSENKLATVVGERLPEVSYVAAHLDALDRYLKYAVSMPELPPPIARIELVEMAGDAHIGLRPMTGGLLVALSLGDERVAAERAAEVAARTWVARVAIAGAKPVTASEGWVRQALACEILAQLRPALVDYWYREAIFMPAPRLEAVIHGQASDAEAFLFWRALGRALAANPSESQQKTLIASAQGEPVSKIIQTMAKSPESWWIARRADLLVSRNSVSHGMRESAEALDDITRFVFDLGNGDVVLTGGEAARHRELVAVSRGVSGRQSALRREIIRQNPVYHNAWRAFGTWLERFDGGTVEELDLLWTDYLKERQLAEALRREVEAALLTPSVPAK